MAKPLDVRLDGALRNDAVNDAALLSLIAEASDARQRSLAAAEAAEAEAADESLDAQDREQSAGRARKARRQAAYYGNAIDQIEARLAARKASPKRQAAEAERADVLAERDEIAARFAEVVPECVGRLTALFAEVDANSERMRAARLNEPNAEAVARGIPGNWFVDHAEVRRFTQMAIPCWSAPGRAWPLGEGASPLGDSDRQAKAIRREVAAREAEREATKWGWYRLTPPGGSMIHFQRRLMLDNRGPSEQTKLRGLYREPWSGGIARTEADRLQCLGVTVEEIDQATALREQAEREAAE